MLIVHTCIANEAHITQRVVTHKDIMPIKLVFHKVSWHKPIVSAVRCEFIAAAHVSNMSITITLDIPGVLVVQVEAESLAVVHDIMAQEPKW